MDVSCVLWRTAYFSALFAAYGRPVSLVVVGGRVVVVGGMRSFCAGRFWIAAQVGPGARAGWTLAALCGETSAKLHVCIAMLFCLRIDRYSAKLHVCMAMAV